jgi:hypothetical protein
MNRQYVPHNVKILPVFAGLPAVDVLDGSKPLLLV